MNYVRNDMTWGSWVQERSTWHVASNRQWGCLQ